MQATLITNDAFELTQCPHPTNPDIKLYVFQMQALPNAQQGHLDALSESLDMICNNASGGKSSIILDCSALTSIGMIKRFWKLSFGKALDVDNAGLDKFYLISESKLLKTLSSRIIRIKNASGYTKIFSTRQDALRCL